MDTKFFYEEKYFDMIISSCGLLSGELRLNRIKEIAKHNVWLAARCKNSCVNEEEELVDILILKCANFIKNFNDIQSIIALLELEEYDVIHWLFTNYKATKKVPQYLLNLWNNKNKTISLAFGVLSEIMPVDVAVNVFNRLQQLGYTLEQQSFNAILSRLENNTEVNRLMQNMKAQGIEPDAETYLHLMRHSSSFKEAYTYFVLCNNYFENDSELNHYFIEYVYSIMVDKAVSQEECDIIYNAYCIKFDFNDIFKLSYLLKSIQINNTYVEIVKYYHYFYETFIRNNLNIIPSNKKSKSRFYDTFKNIINTYLTKLLELDHQSMMYNSIIKIAQSIVNKTIKKRIKTIISKKITQIIPFLNFDECKILVETCDNYDLTPQQIVFCSMLKYIKNPEQIQYVINCLNINDVLKNEIANSVLSNSIHSVIKYGTNECAEYLFYTLNKKKYQFNIIIYNILIKKFPFIKAIKVLDVMRNNGITPDIYSISPLLCKWESVDDLKHIIDVASESNIKADLMSEQALLKRINELGYIKEIRRSLLHTIVEQSWKKTFEYICKK